MTDETPTYDIPKECIAGVVVDEGPNFRVEVQKMPVPEIGKSLCLLLHWHTAVVECADNEAKALRTY